MTAYKLGLTGEIQPATEGTRITLEATIQVDEVSNDPLPATKVFEVRSIPTRDFDSNPNKKIPMNIDVNIVDYTENLDN